MRQACLSALKAEEELEKGVADDRVYDVVLAATGSAERAAAAYSERLMARMRRGEKPEI